MKRCLFSVCIALVLLIACLEVSPAEETLPSEIRNYFSGSSLNGAEITETAHLTDHGNSSCRFVLVRTKDGSNAVYCFKLQNGTWVHSFHTKSAIPQGKNRVKIYLSDHMEDGATDKNYPGPILVVCQLDKEEKYTQLFTGYQLSSCGKWNLFRIWSYGDYGSMVLDDGHITYFGDADDNKIVGTAYGTFQRDLRYVSLSAVPKTLKEARQKLTSAPTLPTSSELKAQEIHFSGGKKYAVYSAPDKNSLRSANGKAAVSTNGWIQVFGRDGNWILIQYSIDTGHYRIGYIDTASLPKKAEVPNLGLRSATALTVGTVSVTDDPLYSQSTLITLPEKSEVNRLATLGDWAYIEGDSFRGFVPVDSLATAGTGGEEHRFYAHKAQNGQIYDLFKVKKMHYDYNHHVYAVTGVYERVVSDEGYVHGEIADNGSEFTYLIASDFHAEMLNGATENSLINIPVTDLYQWYLDAYMNGENPETGNLTFEYDLPQEEQGITHADFWFVTTHIELNDSNEIQFMEYVYVPWG